MPKVSKALALLPVSFSLYFFLFPLLLQGLASVLLVSVSKTTVPTLSLPILYTLIHGATVPVGWFSWLLVLRVSPNWPVWKAPLGFQWQGTFKEKMLHGLGLLLAQAGLMAVVNLLFYYDLNALESFSWSAWPKEAAMFMAFLALGVAPLLEEWVFRGWLQGVITQHFNGEFAIIVSSLVFAMLHGGYFTHPIALLYVLCLGVLYAFWRDKTGSIWPGVVAHTVNNMVALLQGQ